MVKEEVQFLSHPAIKGHPSLVKLIGYCSEKQGSGVVYDLNPRGTLHNLVPKDDLNWIHRVNILLQIARLVEFLHSQNKPFLILNINESHIMLDWDHNPKLCDLGLITSKKEIPMSIGYIDPFLAAKGTSFPLQTSCDVFSFGAMLLRLISKRKLEVEKLEKAEAIVVENLVHCWAKKEYKPHCSLVHKSLQQDWGYMPQDGIAITHLGMSCIEFFPTNRPSMKHVVQHLEGLLVLKRIADMRPYKREKKFHGDLQMDM
ncbi:hypothetical protein UlMin_040021 [Ulmus minor]